MAQEKNIKFASVVTVDSENVMTVNSLCVLNSPDTESTPQEKVSEPNLYKAEITEKVKVENSVSTLEGSLLIAIEDNLVNGAVDINGDLLILYEYSSKFSINANGELIYNF